MARLLPGVYSAINDLSQMPEGAQTLNVGYVVKANRGPVNEFNVVTSPSDFLTKYTFSGTPSLTEDPTFHSVIKVMAQTNSMHIVRAANNPLYGGAIVKKAQEYGPILGVDQEKESFLLMVPVVNRVEGPKPEEGEPITVAGTGLFDGRYIVKKVGEDAYLYEFKDEDGKIYSYNVYSVTLEGKDPIVFDTTGLGYQIVASGQDSAENYYFEVAGDRVADFEAFDGQKITLTVSGDSEAGSDNKDNDGYYVYSSCVLYKDPNAEKFTTRVYIDKTASAPFKDEVEELSEDTKRGQLFANSKFQGTSTYRTPVVALNNLKIEDIYEIKYETDAETHVTTKQIIVHDPDGDITGKVAKNDKIMVKGSPVVEGQSNDGVYTVSKVKRDEDEAKTVVTVKEDFKFAMIFETLKSITTEPSNPSLNDMYFNSTDGKVYKYNGEAWEEADFYSFYTFNDAFYQYKTGATKGELNLLTSKGGVYFNSIVNPEAAVASLGADDLMLITGIDPGAYNGQEAFAIVSAFDTPDALVYKKGAEGLFPEPCTFDTMQLTVYNAETNEALESFTFSRDPEARTIDGTSLFVEDVVAGSAYIKVFNNAAFDNTDVPNSTLVGAPVQASGGFDGDPVTVSSMVKALSVFQDKTIPISILGNGCSEEAESPVFQQALLELANSRKDAFIFLNDRKKDEKASLPSTRAQAIVDYKKNQLASTSFYGCMYAPHVNTPDVFNARDVKIGTDAVAIAGWLNVINSLNYPYAYAGPRNGLVSGVTCDWKIGDMSGEAEMLNDASINYVAYDGRVGRYYMQCQNTLQVANSAMRNIGVVLNVLDIKENLVTYLKEFLNLPITDSLRRDIMDTVGDYLSPMVGNRFYNYVFQDTTTDADLAEDTLRYLLTLSPTRYAQRIYLVMNIVRTGFDFSILQSM